VKPPWPNCWRTAFTTTPEPTIWLGFMFAVDAMTSANWVVLFLKPLVCTFARLCEIVDMSVCAACRPESEVKKDIFRYSLEKLVQPTCQMASVDTLPMPGSVRTGLPSDPIETAVTGAQTSG